MAFPVICVSHTDGSGGEEVGRIVADRLGYRYVNEEILIEAARLAQVDPSLVAATEHKQTLLQRILDSMSLAQEAIGAAALGTGVIVPTAYDPYQRRATKDDLRNMIRAAIHEVSRYGRAVIVTHAASMALAGRPGVLRVLVTAPTKVRSERLAATGNVSPEAAAAAVSEGDAGRRYYLKNFYAIDEELPTHYDLVLNTEHLTPAQVAELVVRAASA